MRGISRQAIEVISPSEITGHFLSRPPVRMLQRMVGQCLGRSSPLANRR